MKAVQEVDPIAVRPVAATIASDHPEALDSTFHYHQAAAIHRYVTENITYVPDPRGSNNNYVASPEETLETGAGDCDCQAVLTASLLGAIGAETRLVRCESVHGEFHMLAEVYLGDVGSGELQPVFDSLAAFYADEGAQYTDFYYSEDDGACWFQADTAMGRYIGDIEILSDEGYIHGPDEAYDWEWHNADFFYHD